MRIAILTLPLQINYGGIIQNYALQTVLQRMGHEVETINLKKKLLAKKYDISFLTKILGPSASGRKQLVYHFVQDQIRLTAPLYNKKDIRKYDFSRFDAVIVGSDQVWRLRYAYPDIDTYFLDFIKNGTGNRRVRKIAFSVSFGIDTAEFSPEQIRQCGKYIQDFDLVTVREESALALIDEVYRWTCKNGPIQTLDPTLLLEKDDYVRLCGACPKEEQKGGLFYYVLDMTEEKRELIRKIARDLGVEPFTVQANPHKWYTRRLREDQMVPPPQKWLEAFQRASYVFTDSFHGSVFSLIFEKEFLAMGNKKRGISRFTSLLNQFHLNHKLIYAPQDYEVSLYRKQTDWNSVREILTKERNGNLNLLRTVLSEETNGESSSIQEI